MIEHMIWYKFGSFKTVTTSTDIWVPVDDFESQSKIRVPVLVQVKDSCQSRDRTVRELHILQPQLILNHTHAKKHKLQPSGELWEAALSKLSNYGITFADNRPKLWVALSSAYAPLCDL